MAEVATAWVTLLPSAKGFGSKLDSEIGPQVDAAGKKRGIGFGKLFAAGAALGLGAKAFSFLGDSLAEATEAGKVTARTENVIEKMGNAANISADQVGKLAASLSAKSGIDDEAIQSGQNLLLTFSGIRNEAGKGNKIFDETSRLMVDMSAAMGTDATSSAKQLGKALNDPVKGVTALTRSGVSFTQQQKDQIKVLQESGDMLGAQKIILGEVERQFGGAAESMATPAEKLGVAWGNLKEQVGTAVLPMLNNLATWATTTMIPALSSLGPYITAIGNGFKSLVGFIRNNQTAVATFGVAVGALTLIIGAHNLALTVTAAGGLAKYLLSTKIVTAATKAWAAIQWVLNAALAANPIGLVISALVALGVGLVIAYKKSETFRNIVDGAFRVVKLAAESLLGGITNLWNGAVAAFNGISSAAKRGAALVGQAWDKIKAGADMVLDTIQALPGKVLALGGDLYRAGLALIGRLRDGVEDAIGAVVDKVQAGLDKIADMLPGSPIKTGPLKSWNNGGAGKRLALLLASGIDAGRADVLAASNRLAASASDPTIGVDYRGIRSNSAAARSAAVSSQAGLLAELRALRAEVARQTAVTARLGREFGMEVNGMFADGARSA